ncbi:DUF742 domain-containing protein [Actinoplanes sp. NPDC049265]|uniref:DUF742 domain-containing protein n=1 Tax=Actinoplanes sp. NPDC049265 TaxID=3363902 RepID=UPI00371F2B2F
MPDPLRAPHDWLDHEAGPVVRPYAVTQGRVAPSATDYDLVAFVQATGTAEGTPGVILQPEHHAIMSACWERVTVVELAARLDLSIGVVRVLLGDLRSAGLISLSQPAAADQPPDVDVLKAVAHGLRAL